MVRSRAQDRSVRIQSVSMNCLTRRAAAVDSESIDAVNAIFAGVPAPSVGAAFASKTLDRFSRAC
jgi:hypothetical protein